MLGVTEKAEKDEIVKAAMELKIAGIEDEYTTEVSTFRQVPNCFLRLYLFMYVLFCEGMQ
jgi:hypothetical protein